MTTTLNQVTIDVPLVTEDGDVITTDTGDPIIVDSFSFRVEDEDLPALTPDEALEFKKGRKLAVTPNGPPKSWEVRILENDEGTTEYLTVFNLRFLGGRHKSLYRALGQISGTYIRFGSKGIPDSLVGGVYGLSSPAAPDSTAFTVNMDDIAPMLVTGDTHMFVLGDSITAETDSNGFRYGKVDRWQPNRWKGISVPKSSGTDLIQSGMKMDQSNGSFNAGKLNSGFIAYNLSTPTNPSPPISPELQGQFTSNNRDIDSRLVSNLSAGDTAVFRANNESFENTVVDLSDKYNEFLPAVGDLFANADGRTVRSLVFACPADDSSDTNIRLTHNAYPETSDFVVAANSYGTGEISFAGARTARTSGADKTQHRMVGPAAADDRVTLMESYLFDPSVDGLSMSYLGDGGWKVDHHADQATALAANYDANPNGNPWYDDVAIQERIRMYGYKDLARTQKRDNIVVALFLGQNNLPSPDGEAAFIAAFPEIRTRWMNAANAVEAGLQSRLRFVIFTQPDVINTKAHEAIGEWAASIAGTEGYENVGLVNLFQAIKSYDDGNGTDYSDPANYTNASGQAVVQWYTGTDGVHSDFLGSEEMMGIAWDAVLEAYNAGAAFTPTVSGDAAPTVGDVVTFSTDSYSDAVYVWTVDGVAQAPTTSATVDVTIADTSAFDVSVVITRKSRAIGTSANFSVAPVASNSAPLIVSFVTPGDVEVGNSLSLIGTVADVDEAANNLQYTITYSLDGVPVGEIDSPLGTNAAANGSVGGTHVPAFAGEYVFTLTVTDSEGAETSQSTGAVTVSPAAPANDPPEVVGILVNGASEAGDTATVSVTGITDDSTPVGSLTYAITFSLDGSGFSPVSTNPTGTVTDATVFGVASAGHDCNVAGDYIFRVVITDSDGASSTPVDSEVITIAEPAGETLIGEMSGISVSGSNIQNTQSIDQSLEDWLDQFVSNTNDDWEGLRFAGNGTNRLFTDSLVTGEDTIIASAINQGYEVRMIFNGSTYVYTGTWVGSSAENRIEYNGSSPVTKDGVAGFTATTIRSEFVNVAPAGTPWTVQLWEV